MNILLYSLAIVFAIISAVTNNIAPLIAGLILVAVSVLSERIGK